MKKNLNPICQSFADLIFPRHCYGCTAGLRFYEKYLCLKCHIALPLSYLPQANAKNNPLVQKLSSLFPLETATSLFYFEKEGVLAHLIHLLKYKGVHQLGTFFGEWLAEHLLGYSFISSVEGIIPVPLHPKRKKIRGYNQAEIIAKTVAQKLNLPLYTAALKRIRNTTSLVLLGDRERENEMAGAILYAKKFKMQNTYF